jgi:uncharacterized protein
MNSPTQLTNFLSCNHLGALELAASANLVTRPVFNNPISELLKNQGNEHEERYLAKLKSEYSNIVELSRGNFELQVKQTIEAMKNGANVIFQGALTDDNWHGYSDFLIRVETPSDLGDYSYIIEDTKLSAEVKGEAIMQLCIYAELVSQIQGRLPDEIAIVGGTDERFAYNPSDFTAYLNYAKRKFLQINRGDSSNVLAITPEPVDHCHTCNWRGHCEERWHSTDHLKLVAGTGRLQRKDLNKTDIHTLTVLAELPKPPKLERGSVESMDRIHKQAQIQLKGRRSNNPEYEFILPVTENQGLSRLPEPNDGDVWFDIEGDAHISDQGLEYLFGWVSREADKSKFHAAWAMNSRQEKDAFEVFIRFVLKQREAFPEMHVYHFGHYETTVVKRLSTRYNLFTDDVDELLRKEVFVDLHRVVKNGLRLSIESYGLKQIEAHFEFERKADLLAASQARKITALLLDSGTPLEEGVIKLVQSYNEEDCYSTLHLHHWLEKLRAELIQSGEEVPRFYIEPIEPQVNEGLQELELLSLQLIALLSEDHENLNHEQQVIKSLADLLLWYRREAKSYWWEFFRMKELIGEELREERKGLAGPFEYIGEVGTEKRSTIYRWKFPKQLFEGDKSLNYCGEDGKFTAYNIDLENNFLDIKATTKTAEGYIHKLASSVGLFSASNIPTPDQINRFKDLANWVIANGGMIGEGDFQAARNLLLRHQTLSNGAPLRKTGESILNGATRLANNLDLGAILPIQGPPGTGKTFTAAHMICELIKAGKKVGITAQSHAVIMNLMNNVGNVNDEKYQLKLNAIKQVSSGALEDLPSWVRGLTSSKIEDENSFDLVGGTAWLWSREGMADKVDVLFIDEGGQFSLADSVAVSHSSSSMVLLGDPQQLENVTQGVHPPEIEVSVLGYWLSEDKVIRDDQGLFLENTYRMHPSVNAFVSETFYAGKLKSVNGLEKQEVISNSKLNGSGLRFVECPHEGNQSKSDEEVEKVKTLVDELLLDGRWVNKDGIENPLTNEDILIVAPYNSQVNALKKALPDLLVGTVDKFQGRQAPVVIYSMATSSPEEAPRGMEFLYSLNRLNVAVSRAQCLAVMVASPSLFELSCKTPKQMRLANAFCRFLEMAD